MKLDFRGTNSGESTDPILMKNLLLAWIQYHGIFVFEKDLHIRYLKSEDMWEILILKHSTAELNEEIDILRRVELWERVKAEIKSLFDLEPRDIMETWRWARNYFFSTRQDHEKLPAIEFYISRK
jgi:hypothetical protein